MSGQLRRDIPRTRTPGKVELADKGLRKMARVPEQTYRVMRVILPPYYFCLRDVTPISLDDGKSSKTKRQKYKISSTIACTPETLLFLLALLHLPSTRQILFRRGLSTPGVDTKTPGTLVDHAGRPDCPGSYLARRKISGQSSHPALSPSARDSGARVWRFSKIPRKLTPPLRSLRLNLPRAKQNLKSGPHKN